MVYDSKAAEAKAVAAKKLQAEIKEGFAAYDKAQQQKNLKRTIELGKAQGKKDVVEVASRKLDETRIGDNIQITEGGKTFETKVVELPTGQIVALGAREITVNEQKARDFKPSDSPYRKEYVEPNQRRNYIISESEKIKPVIIGEKVAGYEDPVAQQSIGMVQGKMIKRSDLFELEQGRASEQYNPLKTLPVKQQALIAPDTKIQTSVGQRIAYIDTPFVNETAKGAVWIGNESFRAVKEDIVPFMGSMAIGGLKLAVGIDKAIVPVKYGTSGFDIRPTDKQAFYKLEGDPDVGNLALGTGLAGASMSPIGKVAAPLIQGWFYGQTGASVIKGEVSLPRAATQLFAMDIAFKSGDFLFGKSKARVVNVVEEVGSSRTTTMKGVTTDVADVKVTQLGFTREKGFLEQIGLYKPDAKVLNVYEGKGTQSFTPTGEGRYALLGDVTFNKQKVTYAGLSVADKGGFDSVITFGGKKTSGMVIRTAELPSSKRVQQFETLSFGIENKPVKTSVADIELKWQSEVLKPSEYAQFLNDKGVLKFNPEADIPVEGRYSFYEDFVGKSIQPDSISISKTVSNKEVTIRHELIHYKQSQIAPEINFRSNFIEETLVAKQGGLSYEQYRQLPVEQIAFGLQDVPFGFEVQVPTGKMTTKKVDTFSLSNYDIKSSGYGRTKELYVEDMFSGKNLFRKDIVTESGGYYGSKQILGSDTVSAQGYAPDLAKKQSQSIVENVLSKWKKKDVLTGTKSGSQYDSTLRGSTSNLGGQISVLESKQQQVSGLRNVPSVTTEVVKSQVAMLPQVQLPKSMPTSGIKSVSMYRGVSVSRPQNKEQPVLSVTGSRTITPLTLVARPNTFQVNRTTTVQELKLDTLSRGKTGLGLKATTVQELKSDTKTDTKTALLSKTTLVQELKQEQKQKQEQRQETKQLMKQSLRTALKITPPNTPPPFRPEVAFMFQKSPYAKKSKKDKTKSKKVKNMYTPSLEAAIFNIRMPRRKISDRLASTGLVVRPIQR